MRIGLIGLGSIGRRHLGNLLALGCEVVAMDVSADARAAAAAQFPHAKVVDALPFTGLDALVIATPAENHLFWVEEAIRRETPFFVEKPLGTLEQLPRWRELAAMQLPVNQVGYMLRFNEAAIRLRDLHPHAGTFTVAWDATKYGHRLEESSHEIDLALWMGASVESVRVYSNHEFRLGAGWCIGIYDRASIYGRQWDVWARAPPFSAHATVTVHQPDELGEGMYVDEMLHFVERAQFGDRTDCTLADGLRVLEVCQQVEQMTKVPA